MCDFCSSIEGSAFQFFIDSKAADVSKTFYLLDLYVGIIGDVYVGS